MEILSIITTVMLPVMLICIGLLWNGFNKVSDKALELERLLRERDEVNKEMCSKIEIRMAKLEGDSSTAREKIKNHIFNCANYQPRIKE